MSRIFGRPIQLGNVVPDVEAAMQGCVELGIGPFFIQERLEQPARYRGERHDLVFTCAFAQAGELQVEFISQDNDAPSAFRDFLERRPEGGLHHLAYYCDAVRDKVAEVNADGERFEVVQEFIFPDGVAHEVYLDPVRPVAGQLSVQLVEPSDDGKAFFDLVRAAADEWDGSRPLRPMAEVVPSWEGGG